MQGKGIGVRAWFASVASAVAFPAVALAVAIHVEGVEIEVPAPQGFVELTPDLKAVYEYQRSFIAPTNVQFAAFISETDLPIALKGEIPPLNRTFTVQAEKELARETVTSRQFAELRRLVRGQNAEIVAQAKAEIPNLFARISEAASSSLDLSVQLTPGSIVPLEPHDESERVFASSMLMSYQVAGDAVNAESPSVVVTAATTTLVHAGGKVLFLYCYGEETALAWTRQASKEWARRVVELNPADPVPVGGAEVGGEAFPDVWSRILAKGIAGAVLGGILGGVVGVLALIRSRRRRAS